jgi:hypothetical protein
MRDGEKERAREKREGARSERERASEREKRERDVSVVLGRGGGVRGGIAVIDRIFKKVVSARFGHFGNGWNVPFSNQCCAWRNIFSAALSFLRFFFSHFFFVF